MAKFPSEEQDRFIVRMPDGMRDRLKAEAKSNGRSLNSEIVQRLQESLDDEATHRAIEADEERHRPTKEEHERAFRDYEVWLDSQGGRRPDEATDDDRVGLSSGDLDHLTAEIALAMSKGQKVGSPANIALMARLLERTEKAQADIQTMIDSFLTMQARKMGLDEDRESEGTGAE